MDSLTHLAWTVLEATPLPFSQAFPSQHSAGRSTDCSSAAEAFLSLLFQLSASPSRWGTLAPPTRRSLVTRVAVDGDGKQWTK